jgi:hypothetical protein
MGRGLDGFFLAPEGPEWDANGVFDFKHVHV